MYFSATSGLKAGISFKQDCFLMSVPVLLVWDCICLFIGHGQSAGSQSPTAG